MSSQQSKANVDLIVIAFYSTATEPMRTERMRTSINTNIDDQILAVLPIFTKPFGWGMRPETRFKAFWYDEQSWISDPKRQISTIDANRVLVVVDESIAYDDTETEETGSENIRVRRKRGQETGVRGQETGVREH